MHDGTSYQLQAAMAYNGLGQRLTTVAYSGGQGATTQYVVDIAGNGQPLMATAGRRNTTCMG